MKKRKLTSLKLNKQSISTVTPAAIKGGVIPPGGSIHGGSCFFCWPTTQWQWTK